jgi:hypothetical protein
MSGVQKIHREILVTMKSENKPEGVWSIIEKISKALSLAAIPLVLGIGGWLIERQLQNQTVKKDYVQIAITILTEPDKAKVDPIIREWAVDLLNDNAPRKFSSDTVEKLKKGEISLLGTSIAKVDTPVDKTEVSINPDNGEKLRYRLGIIGASSTISLSCPHRTLWSKPIKSSKDEEVLSGVETNFDSNDDTYDFKILSFGDIKYDLLVEHIDANGKVLDQLKHIKGESKANSNMNVKTPTGESKDPTASFKTSLHVHVSR